MVRRLWRHGFLAAGAPTLLMTAQPAFAYSENYRTGTTGAYTVYDSLSNPGSYCQDYYAPG